MLIFDELLLGFQNLPKNASTSTFEWLFETVYGHSYFDKANSLKQDGLYIHGFFREGYCKGSRNIENRDFRKQAPAGIFSFALTRDPIKRFLSMYSNRVLFHRELSTGSAAQPRLCEMGLPTEPEINFLVAHLDEYLKANTSIRHHTEPMVNFLGDDLSIYSKLVDVSHLDQVIEAIRAHWRNNGLTVLADRAPTPRRLQTAGRKLALQSLTPESFDRLIDYYAPDYALIPTIDRRETEKAYAAARLAHPDSPAAGIRLSIPAQNSLQHIVIEHLEAHCPAVEVLWVADIPRELPKNRPLRLIGALLLKTAYKQEDWQILAIGLFGEKPVRWHIGSPKLAKLHPDRESARNARFQIDNLEITPDDPVQLVLQSPNGERWPLVSLTAKP